MLDPSATGVTSTVDVAVLSQPYLALIIAAPLVLAAILAALRPLRWARHVAVLVGLGVLGLASATLAEFTAAGQSLLVDPWIGGSVGAPLFAIDGLSAGLLPFAALIGGVVLLVAPRTGAPRGQLARIALSLGLTLALFAAHDPRMIALLWVVSLAPPFLELRAHGPETRQATRVFAIYMGVSSLAFVGGIALGRPSEPGLAALASGLLVVAVLIRKGITPFHSWAPAFFETAPLAASILFTAPQVGAYALARVVLPDEPVATLRAVAIAALVTAVYGAAMAVGKRDARRAYGYLFISQSALIVVGFECVSLAGLTGALTLWFSSGLSLAGLGMALWVLEARRGRLSLDRLHGGYEQKPLLAALFLLLGVASVGFPGTLGFVGEELLVDGAVLEFPLLGFAVAVATALNGIAVMRMFFSLFTGRRRANGGAHLLLRPRETVGFALLGALLVIFGLWPRALLADRSAAAEAMLAGVGNASSRHP